MLRVCIVLHMCSVVSYETTVMHVVACDPHCHQYSGCSRRGEGLCDSYCETGYGLDPSNHTCMSECDLITGQFSESPMQHVRDVRLWAC